MSSTRHTGCHSQRVLNMAKNVNFVLDMVDNGCFEYGEEDLVVLNHHARVFYGLLGYEVPEGFDFSTFRHPTEIACLRMAAYVKNMVDEGDFE